MPEAIGLRFHEDAAFFRAAVNFTAAQTGFAPRLIEKDYFCSVVLQYLAEAVPALVFKGGTCLAKVHLGFYRMSEDLDFVISMPVDATRAERSRNAADPKQAVAIIGKQLSGLRVVSPLAGANASRQYVGVIGYTSLLGSREETVNIEVGLREPVLTSVGRGEAQTLLLEPISGAPVVPSVPVPCLSREEAIAEKLRAALSRRDVAIRDFYDLDHAVRRLGLHLRDSQLLELLRQKLAVPGNDPVDASPARLAALTPQLDSRLKPVLRDHEFAEFDLERAFTAVAEVAAALS